MNMETQNNAKWYQQSLWIIVLLILFFPIGLFIMWRYAKWGNKVKLTITCFFVFLVLRGVINDSLGKKTASPNTSKVQTVGVDNTSPKPTTELTKSVERVNVVVTSQMIKKVDNKYRYFFDIRNQDSKSFEGSVTISLYREKSKNVLTSDTFTTKSLIKPDLSTAVYLDANTGPTNVHGEYGLTKYKYEVKANSVVVNSGEGELTDKFENSDTYDL